MRIRCLPSGMGDEDSPASQFECDVDILYPLWRQAWQKSDGDESAVFASGSNIAARMPAMITSGCMEGSASGSGMTRSSPMALNNPALLSPRLSSCNWGEDVRSQPRDQAFGLTGANRSLGEVTHWLSSLGEREAVSTSLNFAVG